MKAKSRQSGLTLTEMTVVIVTVALLTSFGLPAVRTLFNSMATSGGTRAMISAALASARAIAAKEQRYAGVRFQKAYSPDGPLNAPQYMVFIVHDFDGTGLANGFRAVEGLEPIKLPDNIGVMEVISSSSEIYDPDPVIDIDKVIDKTTFSIVFSPSGKLVVHNVRVRNRDGRTDGASRDDIFNTMTNVVNEIAMFIQDDAYLLFPTLDEEPSRRSFIIYDKTQFDKIDVNRRWSDYLWTLEVIYINPYTGTMINR